MKSKLLGLNMIYMIIGTLLIAFGIQFFFVPFNIIAGGMNGISILFYKLFDISPEVTLFWSNFPLLLISFVFLGKKYTVNTILCSFLLPLFVKMVNVLPSYQDNGLLAAVFGGIISGFGIGLVFKGGSSTGGTAVFEQIFHDYLHIPLGLSVWIVDGLIVLSSFIFFDTTTGLYSLISLYLIGKIVDFVQTGGSAAKTIFIVTKNASALIDRLSTEDDIGITKLNSTGAFENAQSMLLICTLKNEKIVSVKKKIKTVDEKAFCFVIDTKEVLGNGW
ncbi:YitT family protein [Vagococcus xieshaowenii]|uniref:YitT family protein n=1 Tax=Vagococcus xieshaowenii TaxID=2562451 RepID=UPI0014325768|nr:YitT family protein [Vagococcus xieshaowenii]